MFKSPTLKMHNTMDQSPLEHLVNFSKLSLVKKKQQIEKKNQSLSDQFIK